MCNGVKKKLVVKEIQLCMDFLRNFALIYNFHRILVVDSYLVSKRTLIVTSL